MSDKSVLFLDDDVDLRMLLCELLASNAATSFCVGALDEVIALSPQVLECHLAILDVNLGPGQPSGLDVYRWLKANGFRGRVVFLTGHARSLPGIAEVCALGVKVLEKPVSVDEIVDLFDETCGAPRTGSE